jgi:GAF domain-containing protein
LKTPSIRSSCNGIDVVGFPNLGAPGFDFETWDLCATLVTEINMPALTLQMTSLLSRLRESAATAPSLNALERGIVKAIAEQLPHYNWTGFYMLDPGDPVTLVLGAFVGDPTPHTRIPVTQGICGAAAASGQTVVVDDVNADPRYLSCSLKTNSEIVVPIYARGKVVGEIDIDSHAPAAFTEIDRQFLEETARIVGSFIERHCGESN